MHCFWSFILQFYFYFFCIFFYFHITCNFFFFFTGIELSIIFIKNDKDQSERDEDRDGGSESGKERGSDRGSISNMEGMPDKEEEEVSFSMSILWFIFTIVYSAFLFFSLSLFMLLSFCPSVFIIVCDSDFFTFFSFLLFLFLFLFCFYRHIPKMSMTKEDAADQSNPLCVW